MAKLEKKALQDEAQDLRMKKKKQEEELQEAYERIRQMYGPMAVSEDQFRAQVMDEDALPEAVEFETLKKNVGKLNSLNMLREQNKIEFPGPALERAKYTKELDPQQGTVTAGNGQMKQREEVGRGAMAAGLGPIKPRNPFAPRLPQLPWMLGQTPWMPGQQTEAKDPTAWIGELNLAAGYGPRRPLEEVEREAMAAGLLPITQQKPWLPDQTPWMSGQQPQAKDPTAWTRELNLAAGYGPLRPREEVEREAREAGLLPIMQQYPFAPRLPQQHWMPDRQPGAGYPYASGEAQNPNAANLPQEQEVLDQPPGPEPETKDLPAWLEWLVPGAIGMLVKLLSGDVKQQEGEEQLPALLELLLEAGRTLGIIPEEKKNEPPTLESLGGWLIASTTGIPGPPPGAEGKEIQGDGQVATEEEVQDTVDLMPNDPEISYEDVQKSLADKASGVVGGEAQGDGQTVKEDIQDTVDFMPNDPEISYEDVQKSLAENAAGAVGDEASGAGQAAGNSGGAPGGEEGHQVNPEQDLSDLIQLLEGKGVKNDVDLCVQGRELLQRMSDHKAEYAPEFHALIEKCTQPGVIGSVSYLAALFNNSADGKVYLEQGKQFLAQYRTELSEILNADPAYQTAENAGGAPGGKEGDNTQPHANAEESLGRFVDFFNSKDSFSSPAWFGQVRDYINEMLGAIDSFPPEVQEYIRYLTRPDVIKGNALTKVRYNRNKPEEMAIAGSEYWQFMNNMQSFLDPTAPKMNPFGSVINDLSWGTYYGTNETISTEQWHDFVGFLLELSRNGMLEYGDSYKGNDEGYTSLMFKYGKLYIDCWGLIKACAKINMTSEAVGSYSLNGSVNDIYTSLAEKGEIVEAVVNEDGKETIVYPDLKTGYSVFIENDADKEGFDHVMVYVENLEYTKEDLGNFVALEDDADIGILNEKGEGTIRHALVGISSDGKKLQVYDLEVYLAKKKKGEIMWGNQFGKHAARENKEDND